MRRIVIIITAVVLAGVVLVAVGRATAKSIDSIPCVGSEQVTYHVHAHLTIVLNGTRRYYPPEGVGISLLHLCLYWLHTHDASGIIHIEAPHRIAPTLGNFFDIWGQPLSRRHVWHFTVPPGSPMRVYVGRRLYHGDPRRIMLFFHTKVTIEIGPRFIPPPAPNWEGN